MLKISVEHREAIRAVLGGYRSDGYVVGLGRMAPILEQYHPSPPRRLGRRLLDSLFGSWLSKENEAIVHYWALCELTEHYGYPVEQLDHEVPCGQLGRVRSSGSSFADIVVYTHPSRRPGTALVAVECREAGGPDGSAQAASYARALQARYHLFTDSERWCAWETQPHPVDGTRIADIPVWLGQKPLPQKLAKEHRLPPITDEAQLRELVGVCHDRIHAEGLDPAEAFDELVKLLFIKIFDEQEIPRHYEFSVLQGETADDTGQRIRALLRDARERSKYRELFSQPGDDEFSIENRSIRKVVETFQGFSFLGGSLIGIDAKGTVYENMVGSTFRGELGQYFTPRKIVEFMVELLQPTRTDLVLDPACGSGGFLIYVLKRVAARIRAEQANLPTERLEGLVRDFANERMHGWDISPRMVRAARMNMIMHGDGWSGIQRGHGLKMLRGDRGHGSYTLVLSNPPFAGMEMDPDILAHFEVAKNERGDTRGVHRALVFLEQIVGLLGKGGRAGVVLPRSVLENDSYSFRRIRQIVLERCRLLAVVGLPRTAFHHTDCGILGDLLFFEADHSPPKNYPVFVAWAEEVGYDTLGRNVETNDLPALLDAFRAGEGPRWLDVDELRARDNWNPWQFHPEAERVRAGVRAAQGQLVPLTALASVYGNRISRKALRESPRRTLKYLEVRDFDPMTGEFTPTERVVKDLPSRATYELNGEELVLLPNARNSLESGRKVVKIGEETVGMILTNRFLPLRCKVNPDFVVLALNSELVRKQIILKCTGAGSPDLNAERLGEVMVPVPDPRDLGSIDSFMEKVQNALAEKQDHEQEIRRLEEEIAAALSDLAGGGLQERGEAGLGVV